ncbi:MAG TPA: dihydrofolate reductase [Nitrospirota bacterium]|nr:dihydrofolate reductase [Nitrospirota bacterium]
MILSIIAAIAENRVIGRNNKMPWDLPPDRKRFHAITRGHPVILGRKTFESIGRPLSLRTNIILTRQRNYSAPCCIVVHDLTSAFAACNHADEAFICGGADIFRETIHLADRMYLTLLHRPFEGDTFFPEIPAFFTEFEREEINNMIPYAYVLYQRKDALPLFSRLSSV